MTIALLTSSRADYGIYLPLLKELSKDQFFQLKVIAFGTHLSRFHGYTIQQIEKDGFDIAEKVETLILGESEEAISTAMGITTTKFASIWQKLKGQIDLIISLGDRYEMFAAVAASVPFNIPVAHIHGGETTLGAIDNKFRHALSLMSSYHFTSSKAYAEKVAELLGSSQQVYNVGALSLDNLSGIALLNKKEFKAIWKIDLSKPTILCTFHPETVSSERNTHYADVLVNVFTKISKDFQIVITMPNADTQGMIIREKFNQLVATNEKIIGIENFGLKGYFSIMKHCSFLLGNTSSGIIEAASFKKYVINIGDRQKGRASGKNVMDVEIKKNSILKAVEVLKKERKYKGQNIYKIKGSSAKRIVKALKNMDHLG